MAPEGVINVMRMKTGGEASYRFKGTDYGRRLRIRPGASETEIEAGWDSLIRGAAQCLAAQQLTGIEDTQAALVAAGELAIDQDVARKYAADIDRLIGEAITWELKS